MNNFKRAKRMILGKTRGEAKIIALNEIKRCDAIITNEKNFMVKTCAKERKAMWQSIFDRLCEPHILNA